ncbi:MAG: magnesium transporter [Proteobacteria bacterium]|nr:magnesium transporter [Pseudomonadota bacterium]
MFTYFTDIARRDVLDRHGRYVGHPYDFAARLDEVYPRITSLVVSRGTFKRRYFVVDWKDVHQTDRGLQLKVPIETLSEVASYRNGDEPTLRRNILDQQVVDTFNRKLVRVNDLHFLKVDDDLRLAHVDIGFRGLIRRLGWERAVDGVVRLFNRHARYLNEEGLISWKYVQPLSIQSPTGQIQLNVDMRQLKQIPPSDISQMLAELDPYQRAALIKTLDVQGQVDTITELDLKIQRDIIEELDAQTAVRLFERMPSDEATDLLAKLQKRDADRIIGMLSAKKAREISDLMEHEADSAGGLMTKEFIALRPSMTVGQAIDHIRCVEIQKAETIYSAFVVDEHDVLMGSVSFRRLLLEPMEAKIADVMQQKPPAVNVETSVKDVAYTMDKYNLYTLPAIDDDGKLEGIITVDDVLHAAVEQAWGKRGGL